MTDSTANRVTFAADAMCGGLARWLRMMGYDTFYRPNVVDRDLIEIALTEHRILITTDGGILRHGVATRGELATLPLPRGLKLRDQFRYVVQQLALTPDHPRCSACNGPLETVTREQVAGQVPARSLIWARHFYRCSHCGQVFWDGTHWRKICTVIQEACGTAPSPPHSKTDSRPDSPEAPQSPR